MSILNDIFTHKKVEVAARQRICPLASLRREAVSAAPALDFIAALNQRPAPAVIAEIKRASPSKGILREVLDPLHLAQRYAAGGARAISILTDRRHFKGSLEDLARVRGGLPGMPLLRKDFIFDAYQVYESRAAGADAILLIAAYLEQTQLAELHSLALELGMAALVEVHTQAELESALRINPRLAGVNNRDLHTFQTDLHTTLRLSRHIPPGVTLVSESGIRSGGDARMLVRAGVQAILVGEALVTAPDPAGKLKELANLSIQPARADQGGDV